MPPTLSEKVDLTRLSRSERRRIEKKTGNKIPGRNLPYTKLAHGSLENFYKTRAEEIAKENGTQPSTNNGERA